ncbi:hypothetical protein [Endozoicomonas sp. SCSIO W0465]|uniref:hypothetical protein n=1 Tax=Endozoicomonas sp. SCSIO W0465 TaxID=2918516 RepID=UPI0020763264|nr:hypothetical protein [Endozoicomonas sp. SCSIO W0465]USE35353.1 hypothetical protein MJO57_25145 [Endozoicomonas sp. SCSIO W0465]
MTVSVTLGEIAIAYLVTPYGYGCPASAGFSAAHRANWAEQLLVQTVNAYGGGSAYMGKKLSVVKKVNPFFSLDLTTCQIPEVFPYRFHVRQISTTGPEIKEFLS